MGSNRWINKMDVLKDLRSATGGKVGNLDSSYFVVGERPPPKLHFNNEDHEIQLLLGGSVNVQDIQYDVLTPDLQGITKLIRMVEDYDKTDDDDDKDENVCSSHNNLSNHIISISKLNPNVPEFVPQLSSANATVHTVDEVINNISSKTVKNNISNTSNEGGVKNYGKLGNTITSIEKEAENLNVSTTSLSINEKDKTVNDLSLKMDDIKTNAVNQINGINAKNSITCGKSNETLNREIANLEEIKSIATELKNKIVGYNIVSMNTFEMKRQRNVAIANLQKLFSKPLATNNSPTVEHVNNNNKPMKLITPDYYEKCKSSDLPKENDSETNVKTIFTNLVHLNINCDESIEAVKNNSNQILAPTSINSNKLKEKTISLDAGLQAERISSVKNDRNITVEASSSDPQIRDTTTIVHMSHVQNLNKSNPQIQDSIKKVNSWLYKTNSTPKPSPISLNTIAYKRKDNNSKSPNGSAEKKIAKYVIEEYKPSAYADELMKSYMERTTNVKKHKEKVTLANLHVVLKEKDEKIRAQRE